MGWLRFGRSTLLATTYTLRFRIQKDPGRNDRSLPSFFLVQLVSSELGKPSFSPKRLRSYNTFFQKTAVLLIKAELLWFMVILLLVSVRIMLIWGQNHDGHQIYSSLIPNMSILNHFWVIQGTSISMENLEKPRTALLASLLNHGATGTMLLASLAA